MRSSKNARNWRRSRSWRRRSEELLKLQRTAEQLFDEATRLQSASPSEPQPQRPQRARAPATSLTALSPTERRVDPMLNGAVKAYEKVCAEHKRPRKLLRLLEHTLRGERVLVFANTVQTAVDVAQA